MAWRRKEVFFVSEVGGRDEYKQTTWMSTTAHSLICSPASVSSFGRQVPALTVGGGAPE
jgi:hypothetical protein